MTCKKGKAALSARIEALICRRSVAAAVRSSLMAAQAQRMAVERKPAEVLERDEV